MEPSVDSLMEAHFADLTNEQILARLQNAETVKRLEETLGDDILPKIRRLETKAVVFGDDSEITDKHVAEYFPIIKSSVDEMLQIEGPTPEVRIQTFRDRKYLWDFARMTVLGGGVLGYMGTSLFTLDFTPSLETLAIGEGVAMLVAARSVSSASPAYYDPNDRIVSLPKTKLGEFRGLLAHEYVHSVQHAAGIPLGLDFTYLTEGMAEGVRKAVGKESCDDFVRLADLQYLVQSLRSAYRLLAKDLKMQPKKALIKEGLPWIQPGGKMYAYGAAFFHMLETEQGTRVYSDLTTRAKTQLALLVGNNQ